jgi:hypothetical protein
MVKAMSIQMASYGKTFTIFTVRNSTASSCSFDHLRNIKLIDFDARATLFEYNFTDLVDEIMSWKGVDLTRTSDILRLCLAHKYQMSYLDLDIMLLGNSSDIYTQQYVPAAIWAREEASIELTNSAFCLKRDILEDMMIFQRNRIRQREKKWFYTELGPSMFTYVLFNRWPIFILSQNHPLDFTINSIVEKVREYNHLQLHLTTFIRWKLHTKFKMDYIDIFQSIRSALNLKALNVD